MSIKTIHRKLTSIFYEKIERSQLHYNIRLNPNLSQYTSSVLILDATFFGRKGSETQWWLLVAIDGITGDILASKHILQETKEDYEVLLQYLSRCQVPFFSDNNSLLYLPCIISHLIHFSTKILGGILIVVCIRLWL
jgi:hypothetical protein